MATAEQQSDLQFLGLLRALGFERDDASRTAATQRARVDDSESLALPEIDFQSSIGRRGILQGRRSQGLQASSFTRRLLGEGQRETERAATGVQSDAAIARSDIESQLARQLAGFDVREAEGGLAASTRIEQRRLEREALGLG